MTPLMVIADAGHAAICEVLIENGANVDAQHATVMSVFAYLLLSSPCAKKTLVAILLLDLRRTDTPLQPWQQREDVLKSLSC